MLILEKLSVQEGINHEIIVVDQNPESFFSEPESEQLLKVKHIKQEMPNASRARNIGFLQSNAPFVLFIDDDLIPEKDFCANGLAVFKQHHQVKCFSPNVYNSNGPEQSRKEISVKAVAGVHISDNIFAVTDTISAAIFFERNYFIQCGGFDPILFEFAKTAEDQELFLRMQKRNMRLWFVNDIKIYHDEHVAGGCELRTADYWVTRKKCIFSWALRYRIHNKNRGKLGINDIFQLSRSAFMNKLVLTSGIKEIKQNINLLVAAIRESKEFFLRNRNAYVPAKDTFLQAPISKSYEL